MNDRQQKLLNIIISHYTKTAQPVGSKITSKISGLDLSSATIRNEMANLESAGYIFQPHTSAGRVPTEKGYQFYVANFLKAEGVDKKQRKQLAKAVRPFKQYQPDILKEVAKTVAEISENAAFVGFSEDNFYYTGLSNLFSQPEFGSHDLVLNLSDVIDHFDQVISKIFSNVGNDVKIFIGDQNPFSRNCGAVLTRYRVKNNDGIVGILGPLRMDYQNNFNLIRHVKDLINNF